MNNVFLWHEAQHIRVVSERLLLIVDENLGKWEGFI